MIPLSDGSVLRVAVVNDTPYGSDFNLFHAGPERAGGLPPDEVQRIAQANVQTASEMNVAGKEPDFFQHGVIPLARHRTDVVLGPRERTELRAMADSGSWFLICFLGFVNSERLPIYATDVFVVK